MNEMAYRRVRNNRINLYKSKTFKNAIMWIVLGFFLFYTIAPLVWLVISSLKTNGELMGAPLALPKTLQFQNYKNAFEVSGLGRLFLNSIIVSITATILNVIVSSMASYAIARYDFKGKELIFTLISAFILIKNLGLYDTKLALILTYSAMGLPLSIFIIRGFMNTIPKELEEAGVIDGCNFYQIFYKITLPLSRAGIVTAITFQFLYCWNEFIYAMLLTSSQTNRTVQVGIRFFSYYDKYNSSYSRICFVSETNYIRAYQWCCQRLMAGSLK